MLVAKKPDPNGVRDPSRANVETIAPPSIGDAELVARAQSGDRWAEEVLFRRHVRSVGALAMRLLGDAAEAEDVAQESFALAFERLRALREHAAFRGWLMRIVVSRVHRVYRRQRIQRFFGWRVGSSGLADIARSDASPEVRAELALLDAQLARIPARERLAWMLRHAEGLELTEVAEACHCSLATAKRLIASAQTRLKRRLGESDGR
jgi:RNA polymerase sigma-70 factor, ECF subfamily